MGSKCTTTLSYIICKWRNKSNNCTITQLSRRKSIVSTRSPDPRGVFDENSVLIQERKTCKHTGIWLIKVIYIYPIEISNYTLRPSFRSHPFECNWTWNPTIGHNWTRPLVSLHLWFRLVCNVVSRTLFSHILYWTKIENIKWILIYVLMWDAS